MNRRVFMQRFAATTGLVIALPSSFFERSTVLPMSGWVPILRSCEYRGLNIDHAFLKSLVDNFTRPRPIDIEHTASLGGGKIGTMMSLDFVGWLSRVRVDGDTLMGFVEFSPSQRDVVQRYGALSPAFIVGARNDDGTKEHGGRLISLALTSMPVQDLTGRSSLA